MNSKTILYDNPSSCNERARLKEQAELDTLSPVERMLRALDLGHRSSLFLAMVKKEHGDEGNQ